MATLKYHVPQAEFYNKYGVVLAKFSFSIILLWENLKPDGATTASRYSFCLVLHVDEKWTKKTCALVLCILGTRKKESGQCIFKFDFIVHEAAHLSTLPSQLNLMIYDQWICFLVIENCNWCRPIVRMGIKKTCSFSIVSNYKEY